MPALNPANAVFTLVSFEGPDEYSRAGGLGVRVRELSRTLAGCGFRTHLFFLGDPSLPAVEQQDELVLHRWAQWLSSYYPAGVYDGEWEKLRDLEQSLPPYLLDQIVAPAAAQGKVTVVMTEDWQTAPTAIRLSDLVSRHDLADCVIPAWTANNLYGFETIDWNRLRRAAAILTISRYMKHRMWQADLNPLVTPNGIPPGAIVTVPAARARKLRDSFGSEVALFKIGRFDPDKRWIMALEAIALLKHQGTHARILIRGDRSPYGREVLARARAIGLTVATLGERYETIADLATAIAAVPEDVLNLTSFLPDDLLPPIYAAVDGVLANSGHEPFGLVGLEVMGAGGLAYVGSTGEDYAQPEGNAVVLDTDDPREIVVQVRRFRERPDEAQRLRQGGKQTARTYVWPRMVEDLLARLEYVAQVRGVEVNG